MLNLTPIWKKRLSILGLVILVVGIPLAITVWYKFFREVDDGPWASLEERFKYGSVGGESAAGLPYWVWVVLPRVFPDLLPGAAQGGYHSFGLPWEEGREMPIGFTKKTIGFPRVANNCAICHATLYRTKPGEVPKIVPGGPSHTANLQALLRFFTNCAKDPRFNGDVLMKEINQHASLSWLDKLAYRYAIIPQTRKALLKREPQFGWMNRPNWPEWGLGRDDPMNLTKYFMTNLPWDDTVGSADMPSIWNMGLREGMWLNWCGETPSARSVVIDSALGLQAKPGTVVAHAAWIQEFATRKRPPKYPYPIDAGLAAKGKVVFDAHCNSCHGLGGGTRAGQIIGIGEVKTDNNRLITWTAQAADIANQAVEKLGVKRVGITKPKIEGYQAVPLDGIWLRAPYLHNGSVPNLTELLEPQEKRSKVFYRGYDLYDPVQVGFDTTSPEAQRVGYRFDTSVKGNGNQGHLYGTELPPAEKKALIEYLKTMGPSEGDA
jgi:hypothetical protein